MPVALALLSACAHAGDVTEDEYPSATTAQQTSTGERDRVVLVTLRVEGTGTGLVTHTEKVGSVRTDDTVLTGWAHQYVATESEARELHVEGRSRNATLRCFVEINNHLVVTAESEEGQVNCSARPV